ncbi:hypothetical protein ACFVU2_21075 [Leifsonia sp. NPDC058194]|uniref:hypothetical protein n=1 Tax=Leifsonia sp. NPDC058194 TaxID=3346374 RepID=UPI0036D9CA48
MRAALRSEYNLDLRQVWGNHTLSTHDLGDLVTWLPAGSVFWRSIGGPASFSELELEIRENTFWLRVLEWRERGSKGEQPKRAPDAVWAWEREAAAKSMSRKGTAYLERQRRQSG